MESTQVEAKAERGGRRRASHLATGKGMREIASRANLTKEIEALRLSLAEVMESIKEGEGDINKLGGLVSRLCDSIVRALLAQEKLAEQDEGFSWLRGEFQRMLRELGYGEREQAHGSAHGGE